MTIDAYGGLDKAAYEHMKTLAGALEAAAHDDHGMSLHPGSLSACPMPSCVAKARLIRWAYHIEQCRENPGYALRDATYAEVTGA